MSRGDDLYVTCCGTPGHPIKIGHSWNVAVRIRQLACPTCGEKPLHILLHAPGAASSENSLQSLFYQLHENGEWFKDSPRLRLFAEHLKALNPEDVHPTIHLATTLIDIPRFWNPRKKPVLKEAAA